MFGFPEDYDPIEHHRCEWEEDQHLEDLELEQAVRDGTWHAVEASVEQHLRLADALDRQIQEAR